MSVDNTDNLKFDSYDHMIHVYNHVRFNTKWSALMVKMLKEFRDEQITIPKQSQICLRQKVKTKPNSFLIVSKLGVTVQKL